MRVHGTLIKWNTDRGFGFVALPQTHEEIFVHISAFPRDGVQPRIGETISFEVRTAPDGRKRAESVTRSGARNSSERRAVPKRNSLGAVVRLVVTSAAILAVGVAVYNVYTRAKSEAFSEPSESPLLNTKAQRFHCDGRTHCSQMTSCAEAEYFLRHCPGVKMDGNGDGEPCEQQWCN